MDSVCVCYSLTSSFEKNRFFLKKNAMDKHGDKWNQKREKKVFVKRFDLQNQNISKNDQNCFPNIFENFLQLGF